MGIKILFSGCMFALFLILPAMFNGETKPPIWIEWIILILGLSGAAAIWIGGIMVIWGF